MTASYECRRYFDPHGNAAELNSRSQGQAAIPATQINKEIVFGQPESPQGGAHAAVRRRDEGYHSGSLGVMETCCFVRRIVGGCALDRERGDCQHSEFHGAVKSSFTSQARV